jgi:nucleoside-diphosphate-sugar epimerase
VSGRRPYEALRDALEKSDRIVITGASGWLGQSLLHELNLADPTLLPDRVLALGSFTRQIELLDGTTVEIREWNDDDAENFHPTIAVHLAYLTADQFQANGAEQYIATNEGMTRRGLALQALPGLRAFMFASSGAATVAGDNTPLGSHPYSQQKADDESAYLSSVAASSTPTLASRLWSVSGPYCTRPQAYAFSDMVVRALAKQPLEVKARGEVRRRYVDAGEFLAACLSLNLRGGTGIIDSAGVEVEMRELGAAITSELGGTLIASEIDMTVAPDLYLADPASMAAAAKELNITFTELSGQIAFTSRGFR